MSCLTLGREPVQSLMVETLGEIPKARHYFSMIFFFPGFWSKLFLGPATYIFLSRCLQSIQNSANNMELTEFLTGAIQCSLLADSEQDGVP